MQRLTNTRYSAERIRRKNISEIQGEQTGNFMIRNHQELDVRLKREYDIDFRQIISKLEKILKDVVKASKLASETNSSFQIFALDYIICTDGKIKVLEINAFPSISTYDQNLKKNQIYKEMLSRALKFVDVKVRQTKLKIIEGILGKGEIDEIYAINNYDL